MMIQLGLIRSLQCSLYGLLVWLYLVLYLCARKFISNCHANWTFEAKAEAEKIETKFDGRRSLVYSTSNVVSSEITDKKYPKSIKTRKKFKVSISTFLFPTIASRIIVITTFY